MARVTGIGGVFLRSADPKALGAWYAKHLGIEIGDYGATFLWKDEVPRGRTYFATPASIGGGGVRPGGIVNSPHAGIRLLTVKSWFQR